MTSGIYAIRNTVSGRVYIGSSVNIERRWGLHRHELRHEKHHSCILQRSWDKHGENVFVFEVLHIVPPELLIEHEQDFFDRLKPSMNIHRLAASPRGVRRSIETRLKLSMAKRGIQPAHLAKYSQACAGKVAPHVAESNRRRAGVKLGPYTQERRDNISKAKKGVPNLKNRGVKKPWLVEMNRSRKRQVFGPPIRG